MDPALVTTLVLALRGAAAVFALATLAGGIPRLVQLGLAVVLGLWAATIAHPAPIADPLILVAVRELTIGAALGVVAAGPLVAARTAGSLVDLAATGRAQGPYGALFGILAAAVFVGVDGHVAMVTGVVDSYVHVPPDRGTAILDALIALVPAAVRLAVPWLVTAAIVELAIGAGTRLAARAGAHVPAVAAAPAALVMITATLVGTLAVGIATLVRHGL
jgi:flagellar biosynthesis protein FliR